MDVVSATPMSDLVEAPHRKSDPTLDELLARARRISDEIHGKTLKVYVPGRFIVDGRGSRFPTVSITGVRCDLGCDHCGGTLLKAMPGVTGPDELVGFGLRAFSRGAKGMLITGGCDGEGRLPWERFLPAIARLRAETSLALTIHPGKVTLAEARALKEVGICQALVDVTGDDDTARKVYRRPGGIADVVSVMRSLETAGLEIVPHIVYGVYYGAERGERAALQILRGFSVRKIIVVVLRPARGTVMEGVRPPEPACVAAFLAHTRLMFPEPALSLGCARPGGKYRWALDELAVRAGINALAVPSFEAVRCAEALGLEIIHRDTCCSIE
jgi:uncharacterized radical SAM superfamily protein